MKKYFLFGCLLMSLHSYAGLESLTDDELYQVEGQGGADLALKLSLNHRSDYTFDTGVCPPSQLQYCRLGIAVNNRVDSTGRKQWVVFKGIQGTINLQQVRLTGVDVAYANTPKKAAIQLEFFEDKPILIRNFGFQSLSIETDTHVEATTGTPPVGFIPGYLATSTYTSAHGAFDATNPLMGTPAVGREKGFLGLNMHGNLVITGEMKIFGCGSSGSVGGHPRC